MRRLIGRTIQWATVSLAALMLAGDAVSADGQAPSGAAAVYFTGYPHSGCGFEAAGRLAKAGFAVNARGWPGLQGEALTWEVLKQHNMIVLMGLGESNGDFTLTDKNQANIELLHRYLNEGGGILYIPTFCQQRGQVPTQQAFANPLGCEPLFDETICDPETAIRATTWNIDFAQTSNVLAGSPLTRGVTSLWYPVATRVGAQVHSVAARFDDTWTVVLKGGRTAGTMLADAPTHSPADSTGQGTYSREVPLAACRSVGKGRIVYLGITPEYLFNNCAATTLEGIVADQGLRKVPSHGWVFIENALRWLAEPSLAEGVLGGAENNPALAENVFKTKPTVPFDWSTAREKESVPLDVHPAVAGLIGARTAFTSGAGTVEQWVTEARKNGLGYLVFLEEFASLSPEEFAALKQECARLTTKDFAAIPGFAIDDEVGHHYFFYGTSFPYPEGKFLTADGTRFASFDPGLDAKNPRLPGQLSMTTLEYAYGVSSFKLTAGHYQIHDAAPFANFFCNWDAFAVIVSEQGKRVDDATVGHRQVAAAGQGALPIAIDFMTDPGQLATSPWRTVLRLPPSGASAVGDELSGNNAVAAYWDQWHFYPDNPTRIFITSGPVIESWGFTGPRDYDGGLAGDFVWPNLRWRVHGKATSAVGLQEVAVYDGETLFRRFLPAGKAEFAFDLELPHDQQHSLTLVVTDVEGKRAIGQEQWDRNHRLQEFNCSDRNNQLSYGYLTNKDGFGIMLGGNQPLATPNKRVDGREISPSGTFKNDPLLGAPAFDGAAGGEPCFFAPASLRVDGGEVAAPSVCESFRLLHTGDVNIGEGRYEHSFTDGIRVANVWHTLWRTESAADFTLVKRNMFVNIDPDNPLAVFLWTMRLTLKKDLPNRGVSAGFIRSGEAKLWAVRGSDGTVRAGRWEGTTKSTPRSATIPFEPNAYAAMLDSPLGAMAAFPLTSGLQAELSLPERQGANIVFTLPGGRSPQKAGESAEIAFLMLGIPRATAYTKQLSDSSTETVERFYRDFGLDGGKTGYTLTLAAGTVLGQRYVLDIDGRQANGFSGVLEGDLVSSLPLTVSNLNDRWTAYLFDRTLKQARPLGMLEGKAWARLILHGTLDVFVGHPVTCDRPELFLTLVQTGADAWALEVHNPTDQPLKTVVAKNPFFDPLQDKALPTEPLDVPAGQSINLNL